jgi:ankyrin repeat protein
MKTFLKLLVASPIFALAFTQSGPVPDASKPFYTAIRADNLSELSRLIQSTGVKLVDGDGNTPLMYAASSGSAQSMRLLLDAGADANLANKAGATPLMWCAGDAAKVKLLLAHGADVNVQSKLGCSPLELAAFYDSKGDSMRLLLDKGAQANVRDKSGATALEAAANSNDLGGTRLLLEHGADVNNTDLGGFTPLMAAAGCGYANAEMVKLFVKSGAKVNTVTVDKLGQVLNGPLLLGRLTPLQIAATTTYGAAEALVQAGADVNAEDVRKATPLVFAVANDHPDLRVIKLLITHGAKIEPAVAYAKRYDNPAVLSLLGLKPESFPMGAASTYAVPASSDQMRYAISKALAACQGPASNFQKTGGCVSCHGQIATGIAIWTSKPRGIQADYKLEAAQSQAVATTCAAMRENLFQFQDPGGSINAVDHLLLDFAAAGRAPDLTTDALIHYVCAYQRREGDWPLAGIVRPPMEEGSFTFTAVAIRALRAYPMPGLKPEIDERIERGLRWLQRARPTTTEDRSMQILGIAWAGKPVPVDRVGALVSRQRSDGGWGQTDNLCTDAYATGEALVALHESGMKPTDPVYSRGVAYLLGSQQVQGSWHVTTRSFALQPYFESGFPYDRDQFISQQGTAYATMALDYATEESAK